MRATLKEHTLIFDFGRKPWQAAFRFLNHGHPFVVTEQNQDMIQAHEKIHFIAGDPRKNAVLHQANIQKVKHLIAALSHDLNNLFVLLSTREFNPEILIINCLK